MKTKSIIESWRENPYKVATIVLAGLCLLTIISILIDAKKEIDNNEKFLCEQINSFPTWHFRNEGFFLHQGIDTELNKTQSSVWTNYLISNSSVWTNYLISNSIMFIYKDGCEACGFQIERMGKLNWEKYKFSGLTLNCSEYKK